MDNARIIAKYCELKLSLNKKFTEYINSNPSFIFLFLDDTLIGKDNKRKLKLILKYQNKQFEQIKNDIIRIKNIDNGFVGLKGFFLQSMYYPKEYTRIFGDIDILVDMDNGYSVFNKFITNGYRIEKQKGLYRKISHSKLTISIIKKIYMIKNKHIRLEKDDSLIVELHTNLNANNETTCKTSFNMKRMISDSIIKEIDGINCSLLCPEDNLLYLMFHAVEHLSYLDLYGNCLTINLQHIYDIAQIIDAETIDWDLFCQRATEYNICPFASIFIKIFNDIFENKIPYKVSKSIFRNSYLSEFVWKDLFCEVFELEASEIILGDYRKIPMIMNCSEYAKCTSNTRKVWKKLYLL